MSIFVLVFLSLLLGQGFPNVDVIMSLILSLYPTFSLICSKPSLQNEGLALGWALKASPFLPGLFPARPSQQAHGRH